MPMFVFVVDSSLMKVSISALVHDPGTMASSVQSAIAHWRWFLPSSSSATRSAEGVEECRCLRTALPPNGARLADVDKLAGREQRRAADSIPEEIPGARLLRQAISFTRLLMPSVLLRPRNPRWASSPGGAGPLAARMALHTGEGVVVSEDQYDSQPLNFYADG